MENEIQEERKRQIVGSGCGKVAELSLPIPDVHSLAKFYNELLTVEKTKLRKNRLAMAHFKKSVDWEKEREHKVAFTIFFVQFDLVS